MGARCVIEGSDGASVCHQHFRHVFLLLLWEAHETHPDTVERLQTMFRLQTTQ